MLPAFVPNLKSERPALGTLHVGGLILVLTPRLGKGVTLKFSWSTVDSMS